MGVITQGSLGALACGCIVELLVEQALHHLRSVGSLGFSAWRLFGFRVYSVCKPFKVSRVWELSTSKWWYARGQGCCFGLGFRTTAGTMKVSVVGFRM